MSRWNELGTHAKLALTAVVTLVLCAAVLLAWVLVAPPWGPPGPGSPTPTAAPTGPVPTGPSGWAGVLSDTGRFLPVTAVRILRGDDPLAKADIRGSAAALANGMGMSGSDSTVSTHGAASPDRTMALAPFEAGRTAFEFDLGRTEAVGQVVIWNFNTADGTDAGIRSFRILVSEDGSRFVPLSLDGETQAPARELSRADGSESLRATAPADGAVLDLGGLPVRAIRIVAESTWGRADACGLAEVRIYGFKPPVRVGAFLPGSPLQSDSEPPDAALLPVTNGVGLSHPADPDAVHDDNPAHMWRTPDNQRYEMDLGGTYPVSELRIWNYNAAGDAGSGLRTVRVAISVDGQKWTTVFKETELAKAAGAPGQGPTDVLPIGLPVRYVRIIPMSREGNWGGDGYGLSALRAYCGSGYYAEPAQDWDGVLSRYNGWTGADGIYAVRLSGDQASGIETQPAARTLLVFSDTLIGTVDPVTRARSNVKMPNQTFALFEGNDPATLSARFYYPGSAEPSALPLKPEEAGAWYWFGDLFSAAGRIYGFPLVLEHLEDAPAGFNFQQTGVDLAVFPVEAGLPDMKAIRIIRDAARDRLSFVQRKPKHIILYGGGVLENTAEAGASSPDGYLYIYGYLDDARNQRLLTCARVEPARVEDLSAWRYYTEDGTWSDRVEDSAGIVGQVSPELSVTEIRFGPDTGKYLLTYTPGTMGDRIAVRVGESPVGPFGEEQVIFCSSATRTLRGKAFSYNAKAHPVLSRSDEVLISFNTNGGDWSSLIQNADIYRPRFIRWRLVPER